MPKEKLINDTRLTTALNKAKRYTDKAVSAITNSSQNQQIPLALYPTLPKIIVGYTINGVTMKLTGIQNQIGTRYIKEMYAIQQDVSGKFKLYVSFTHVGANQRILVICDAPCEITGDKDEYGQYYLKEGTHFIAVADPTGFTLSDPHGVVSICQRGGIQKITLQ